MCDILDNGEDQMRNRSTTDSSAPEAVTEPFVWFATASADSFPANSYNEMQFFTDAFLQRHSYDAAEKRQSQYADSVVPVETFQTIALSEHGDVMPEQHSVAETTNRLHFSLIPTLAVEESVSDLYSEADWPSMPPDRDNKDVTLDLSYDLEYGGVMYRENVENNICDNTFDSTKDLETTREVTQKECVLDDGTVKKSHCTTTKQFRPRLSSELAAAEQTLDTNRVLIGVDVDEQITLISPDISNVNDPNVISDERVEYYEDVLDGNVLYKKKTTTVRFNASIVTSDDTRQEFTVSGKPADTGQIIDLECTTKAAAADEVLSQETLPLADDIIQSRCEEQEEQQTLDDGSTVKRHVTITTFFKPKPEKINSQPSADGVGTQEIILVEEILKIVIEERITQLPKGVIVDSAKKIDMKTTVEELEEFTTSGVPVNKTIIRISPVTFPDVLTLGSHKVATSQQVATECDKTMVVPDISAENEITENSHQVRLELFDVDMPSLDNVRVDAIGDMETIREVTGKERVLDDGTVEKSHCTTTKRFRSKSPSELEAVEHASDADRVLVSVDVEEQITLISPNVNNVNDPNVISDERVEYCEDVLDGNVPYRKKTTSVRFSASIVTLDDTGQEFAISGKPAAIGQIIDLERTTEAAAAAEVMSQETLPFANDIQSRCEEQEEQQTLDDGSTVKRHVITTTFFKPAKPDFQPSADKTGAQKIKLDEEIVRMTIEERITRMPKGVTDDSAKDIDTTTTVEELDALSSSGVPVKKKIIRICSVLLDNVSDLDRHEVTTEQVALENDTNIIVPDVLTESEITESSQQVRAEMFDLDQHLVDSSIIDVYGDLETTRKVTEKEIVLDDGTVEKSHCTITKHFRPRSPSEPTAVEQASDTDRMLVSVDVDEQITLIPPDVSNVNDPNITSDERVEYFEDVLDGSVPYRKKTTTVRFNVSVITPRERQQEFAANGESAAIERVSDLERTTEAAVAYEVISQETVPLTDDLIQSRCEEHEEQRTLDDGSTVNRQITTTTFFKPAKPDSQLSADDVGTGESEVVEDIVRMANRRAITRLPKGVTVDSAKDIDTTTTVEELEEFTPSGIPVKKTVISICPATLSDVTTLSSREIVQEQIAPENDKRPVTLSGDVTNLDIRDVITEQVSLESDATIIVPDISMESEITEGSSQLESEMFDIDAPVVDSHEIVREVTSQPLSESVNFENDRVSEVRPGETEVAVCQPKDGTNELVTTRDVTENECVLDDGTVQRTVSAITKQFRPRLAAEVIAGDDTDRNRVLVGIDINERVTLIPSNVSNIDNSNITSDERVEYHEDIVDGGIPCRKTSTITEYRLLTSIANDVPEIPPDVAVIEANSVERLDTEYSSVKPGLALSHDYRFDIGDAADQNDEKVDFNMELTPEVSVINKPSVSVKVSQKIRRIGSDGAIEETYTTDQSLSSEYDPSDSILRHDVDAALAPHDVMHCRFLSVADVDGDSPAAGYGVQVYAKTLEDEPVVEHTVQEYDDVQEDGTLVHRRVTKTTQKKTIVQQVFVQGGDDGGDADVTLSGPTLREYTDVSVTGPEETQSQVEETEEVGADGSIVRRKVTTTSHHQLVTERHMVAGRTDDDQLAPGGDSDVSLEPVNGKQSPQSYIPELMKLSGTESDSTKEPGEHARPF